MCSCFCYCLPFLSTKNRVGPSGFPSLCPPLFLSCTVKPSAGLLFQNPVATMIFPYAPVYDSIIEYSEQWVCSIEIWPESSGSVLCQDQIFVLWPNFLSSCHKSRSGLKWLCDVKNLFLLEIWTANKSCSCPELWQFQCVSDIMLWAASNRAPDSDWLRWWRNLSSPTASGLIHLRA